MKVFLFVLAATIFEASGDAVIRLSLRNNSLAGRVLFFVFGSVLLALYGTSLNLAPVDFATVTGLYVATLIVAFQVANYLFFDTTPTPSVIAGTSLIVAGGLVI
jgi:multidrug transporter EmrE-like cation transporter